MLMYTDTKICPWYDVPSDIKKHARLNCIKHILDHIPYDKSLRPAKIVWPKKVNKRDTKGKYKRIRLRDVKFVPEFAETFLEKKK